MQSYLTPVACIPDVLALLNTMAEPAYRRSDSRSPRGPRQHGRRALSPKASRHNGRRSRDRSYSDDYSDDYTDYSDSFASEEDPYPPRKNKPTTGPKYGELISHHLCSCTVCKTFCFS